MFKCNNCGHEFENCDTHFETHGLSCGPFEEFSTCPSCRSTDFEDIGLEEQEDYE